MPICTRCHQSKIDNEFTKDPRKINGLKSQCNECKNRATKNYKRSKRKSDREWTSKINQYQREYLKNNPDKAKKYYKTKTKEQHLKYGLKHNYNITLEFYKELEAKQKGVCAICGFKDVYFDKNGNQFFRRLAVDHCHETGKVRGLLCSGCNGGLGLLRDNIDILKQAIIYLTKEA